MNVFIGYQSTRYCDFFRLVNMHEIQSNSGAAGYSAGLSFAMLEQTASFRVNHFGRSVAVTPQPVVLELGNLAPPAYSEIDQDPPPSYLEAAGQQPRAEESSSILDQWEDNSADKCWKNFKNLSLSCLVGCCLAFGTYIIFR